ncbi:MAG: hypothetical protein ACI9R3_005889 [Verrucomicrobiales bacterium]|jgi:hypothetical protein
MQMQRPAVLSVVLASVLLSSCEGRKDSGRDTVRSAVAGETSPIVTRYLATRSTGSEQNGLFHDVREHGIDFFNHLDPGKEISYLTNGSGVAVGDVDGDGLADVFLCGLSIGNRLYLQTETFKFSDATERCGIRSSVEVISAGAAMADVNNDGSLDLYVCNYLGPNELYINQGDGRFVEMGAEWNLDYGGPTTMASFADYDLDGDLDVYLVNNRRYKAENDGYEGRIGRTAEGEIVAPPDLFVRMNGHLVRSGHKDLLLRNDGASYRDVTDGAGIGISGYGMGLSATWWDFNSDNQPDLWVCNDLKTPDHLYVNQGGGVFRDVAPEVLSYTSWNSMGADFADFNNDGQFDFLASDMSATTHFKEKVNMGDMSTEAWFLASAEPRQMMRNCLYINSGTGSFLETAYFSGVARTDWTWSVKCADFDCDGWNDIYVTNGMVDNSNDSDWAAAAQKLIEAGKADQAGALRPPQLKERNLAFRNINGLQFQDVSAGWGIDHEGISHGASLGDLDNDGDLDMVVQNYGENVSIYRNDTVGNRITVSLKGSLSNRFGVGATVTIRTTAGLQKRMLSIARGYMSSDQPIMHFGLADVRVVEELTVRWPSGIHQTFGQLPANRHYEITEKGESDAKDANPPTDSPSPLFTRSSEVVPFRHVEEPYDDFAIQKLLPNRLSTLGPGQAWADFNGDGLDDVYFGGASGQAGRLVAQNADGTFRGIDGPWSRHFRREDMGIVWLDADSDGDLDLYVASGSNEGPPGSEIYQDRLYINSGDERFSDLTGDWLPPMFESTSVVRAGDFDGDGDPDLFVGSRMVPGEYPKPSKSVILRNTGRSFEECNREVAPHLARISLVTDAVWIDFDNDGQLDLAIVSEWGPVTLLKNENGRLADTGRATGLAAVRGWWNGIAAADLDGNGFTDFVVSNFGANTKYGVPSVDKPRKLFYGDLDGNGVIDLVEAKVENENQAEVLLPVRGRSCSTEQLPGIKEKFPTFRSFASASLTDIYNLDRTQELIANELHSVVLLNDGAGAFQIGRLPSLAQLAPAFGIGIADFDLDGSLDIFLAQNFYGPQIETGRMSGGLGAVLKGRGDGTFDALWPLQSGVEIPEDARSIAVADLNADRVPDVVVTLNSGPVLTFINNAGSAVSWGAEPLEVVLRGPAGNPLGAGATVELLDGDMPVARRLMGSNSGYLSQSAASVFFVIDDKLKVPRIRVAWPGGARSETQIVSGRGRIVIDYDGEAQNLRSRGD